MVFLGKRHPVSKATNHPRETKHQRPSRFLGRAKLFSPHRKVWVGGAKYLISPPCRRPARSPQGGRSALINALFCDLRKSVPFTLDHRNNPVISKSAGKEHLLARCARFAGYARASGRR